jgi:methylenetetrahydrofolate dehydrogenase (NADP+)/methenyltetrahydrofolate cyclohydrolase
MAVILDGKAVSKKILLEIGNEISTLKISPKLAIVFVGDDAPSEIYVRNKMLAARDVAIETQLIRLPPTTPLDTILGIVADLNGDASVNGIIVQAPLPHREMQSSVFNAISAKKDVDGFSDSSVARLVRGYADGFAPCTPLGIYTLLEEYGIGVSGKHVAIIGRGNLVGRPLSILLSRKSEKFDATVTLCHSATKNLATITQMADIVVVAIGEKHFLKKEMIGTGTTVVDVGINRELSTGDEKKYAICGDVDFENVKDMCHAITPVPGGVGPMTVAMLMRNTLTAAKIHANL